MKTEAAVRMIGYRSSLDMARYKVQKGPMCQTCVPVSLCRKIFGGKVHNGTYFLWHMILSMRCSMKCTFFLCHIRFKDCVIIPQCVLPYWCHMRSTIAVLSAQYDLNVLLVPFVW